MKVLVADKFEQSGLDGLKAAGCEVVFQPDASGDALVAAIEQTQAPRAGRAVDAGHRSDDGCGRAVADRPRRRRRQHHRRGRRPRSAASTCRIAPARTPSPSPS